MQKKVINLVLKRMREPRLFRLSQKDNKQLLDEVFVISGAEADNTYRDLDYLGSHKNQNLVLM